MMHKPPLLTREGSKLLIRTDNPTATAADALAALGQQAARLRGVGIVQPSLDSVYLALTQRRYSTYEGTSPDNTPIDHAAPLWQQWRAPLPPQRLGG